LAFEGQTVDPNWTADLSGGKPMQPSLGGINVTRDGWACLVLNDRPEFNPRDCRFRVYTPQGRRLFSICHGTKGFWDKPGEEISFCMQMCQPVDEYVFLTDTPGAVHVFTRDGLYLTTLLESGDRSPDLRGSDARYQPQGEMWYSHTFRNTQNKQVYLIAEPNAQPLVLVYQVTGLEGVKRFTGTCELTVP
jgi:hypothetical protein